jgi:hypothetical protein
MTLQRFALRLSTEGPPHTKAAILEAVFRGRIPWPSRFERASRMACSGIRGCEGANHRSEIGSASCRLHLLSKRGAQAALGEGIEQPDAALFEVAYVSGHERLLMHLRNGGDQHIRLGAGEPTAG